VGIEGPADPAVVDAGTFSSAPPPPHPERLRTARRTVNVRNDVFVTTTPRLLATTAFFVYAGERGRIKVLVHMG
jgi:hypothetical protein